MNRFGLLAVVAALAAIPAWAGDTPAPEGAAAYIVSPADGATVASPVTVVFGLSGIGVAPAGTEADNTGHHHLIIDSPDYAAADMAEPIPNDETHRHFGGGQTQVTLDLAPGDHTLQLVLGDAFHVPHTPPVLSQVVTVTVE